MTENTREEVEELERMKHLISTKLQENDYYNIYYILKDNNEDVTLNKSGCYFDLMNLQKKTLDMIRAIIHFRVSETQKK